MQKYTRFILIFINSFISVTAIPGGIALVAGFYPPPVELLSGSPFNDYLIPGIALAFLVGGSALSATVFLIRNKEHRAYFSLAAAAVILVFETVEIIVIGSPEGVARNLQVLYITLGVLSAALSLILILKDGRGVN